MLRRSEWRWEGGWRRRRYIFNRWLKWLYSRNHHNIVKQLSSSESFFTRSEYSDVFLSGSSNSQPSTLLYPLPLPHQRTQGIFSYICCGGLWELLDVKLSRVWYIPYDWVALEFLSIPSCLYWASNSLSNPVQVSSWHGGFYLSFCSGKSWLSVSTFCLFILVRMDWWFLSSIHTKLETRSPKLIFTISVTWDV